MTNQEEEKYIPPLFEFIFNFFVEIFGEDIMSNEECVVSNSIIRDCPVFLMELNPVEIITNVDGLAHWAQYIFHLSHELCHYAIHQQKKDKKAIISWFEESICEAMALYILLLAEINWEKCALSTGDPDYKLSIKKYREQKYLDVEISVLKRCKTLQELWEINMNSENDRKARSMERNYLYHTFCSMPDDIKNIIYYSQYIQLNNLLVDFPSWRNDYKAGLDFINKLSEIQPDIIA